MDGWIDGRPDGGARDVGPLPIPVHQVHDILMYLWKSLIRDQPQSSPTTGYWRFLLCLPTSLGNLLYNRGNNAITASNPNLQISICSHLLYFSAGLLVTTPWGTAGTYHNLPPTPSPGAALLLIQTVWNENVLRKVSVVGRLQDN